jgi:hypothetical protein
MPSVAKGETRCRGKARGENRPAEQAAVRDYGGPRPFVDASKPTPTQPIPATTADDNVIVEKFGENTEEAVHGFRGVVR